MEYELKLGSLQTILIMTAVVDTNTSLVDPSGSSIDSPPGNKSVELLGYFLLLFALFGYGLMLMPACLMFLNIKCVGFFLHLWLSVGEQWVWSPVVTMWIGNMENSGTQTVVFLQQQVGIRFCSQNFNSSLIIMCLVQKLRHLQIIIRFVYHVLLHQTFSPNLFKMTINKGIFCLITQVIVVRQHVCVRSSGDVAMGIRMPLADPTHGNFTIVTLAVNHASPVHTGLLNTPATLS